MKIVATLVVLLCVSFGFSQSIIISEIMQNPDDVTDANGEWFELYNAGISAVDINGWTISDLGTDSHTISNGGPLTIPAGGFLVLARNANTVENGNLPADYEYSSFTLGNTDDEIILTDDLSTEIDRVEYDGGPNWPSPSGASMVFIGAPGSDNNDPANWTTATVREANYGTGTDFGSPGTNGSDQSLPVELSLFAANAGDSRVTLKWVTASEIDNQGFAILRSLEKEDGYEEIDSYTRNDALRGAGTSSSENSYSYTDRYLSNGVTYWYKLVDVDANGVRTEHGPVYATPHVESVKDVGGNLPKKFELLQNYPNPFNPETSIRFDVPALKDGALDVTLAVFNSRGQLIATLFEGAIDGGSYKATWNGRDDAGNLVPSGVYIYRLQSPSFTESRRMLLIK